MTSKPLMQSDVCLRSHRKPGNHLRLYRVRRPSAEHTAGEWNVAECFERGAILPAMVQFAGTERPKVMFESQRRGFMAVVLVLCATAPFLAPFPACA